MFSKLRLYLTVIICWYFYFFFFFHSSYTLSVCIPLSTEVSRVRWGTLRGVRSLLLSVQTLHIATGIVPCLSWWKATPLTEALFNLNLPNKWTRLNLPWLVFAQFGAALTRYKLYIYIYIYVNYKIIILCLNGRLIIKYFSILWVWYSFWHLLVSTKYKIVYLAFNHKKCLSIFNGKLLDPLFCLFFVLIVSSV